MPIIFFSQLPKNVARSAFRDTVATFLQTIRAPTADEVPEFIIHLEIPERPTAEYKHDGTGSIEIKEPDLMAEFLSKLKTEPIMFQSGAVVFSREPIVVASSSRMPDASSQSRPERALQIARPPSVADSHTSMVSTSYRMNLNRAKHVKAPPERSGPKPENPQYERKLQHRLSVLGQRARLENFQFGVLRGKEFSAEYSRDVLESGGDLLFKDDQKTLLILLGGTHQDPIIPSIAISIQTINAVALGTDYGKPYMFLELLQNPHFEREDAVRSTTGIAREDARRSRTRHSALDPAHRRVAPYTSRWLKLSFYSDGFYPDQSICELAGLPPVILDPDLTFAKRDLYSLRNIGSLEKWLQSNALPWEVAFQCEALFSNGVLVPQELMLLKPLIEELTKESPVQACDALMSFRTEMEGAAATKKLIDFKHENIVPLFKKHINDSSKKAPISRLREGSAGSNFMCHHVKVTPTAVFLAGPLAEQSNRVIRRYPGFESNFIRVSFTDEGDTRSRFDFEVDTNAFSQARVGRFLKTGLQIASRHYALLGYSQSGFRDHACFFSSDFKFGDLFVTPELIRLTLGSFPEKVLTCSARYGARMSQAFSSTDPSITVPESYIVAIPDIQSGKHEFTDGCGTISRELAEEVWQGMLDKMPRTRRRRRHMAEPTPCAFQIRLGGSKGMVRLDPKLTGKKLCLRPSMTKFEAPGERNLEIARAFEKPSPCYLNRPLIMLMWTNGVESSVFEDMMQNTLKDAVEGLQTFEGAKGLLFRNRLGGAFHLSDTFHRLSKLKLELDQPGVRTKGLDKLLNGALYHIKVGLKHKARIPVPDSYTLVGVCDEDNYLRPREIYACVQRFDHITGETHRHHLEGRVLVTRSPVIHPGDAQILWAIGTPPPGSPFEGDGNHLPNCVVFSTRGPRPVPNMLGGGDLDGDLYNLIPLPELIPWHTYAPALYPPPKLKKNPEGRESTIDDIADFMILYICNDALGAISIAHLVIASSAELRARDENCMTNAALHSKAVDFVKTGYYVASHEIRRPMYRMHVNPNTGMGMKPDWQAGHGRDVSDGQYYECDSVLGRLFRAVELPKGNPAREPTESLEAPKVVQKVIASYVARYAAEVKETFNNSEAWVQALLSRYISELNHICISHTISSETSERVSEVEAMLGTNLESSAADGSSLIERMRRLTNNLAGYVRLELEGEEGGNLYEWLGRAWKAYVLTSNMGEQVFGTFSFSWIALDSVLTALGTIDPNFLPNTSPCVPPFPITTLSEEEKQKLDRFAPVDLDNWTWDDEPNPNNADQNSNRGAAFTPSQNGSYASSSNGNRYYERGGGNPGWGQRGGYANGNTQRGHGRGRGWGQSPRGSYNAQADGNSSRGQASPSRPSRARGFRIVQ